MAFERIIKLSAGPNATGLIISGLNVEFNVIRSTTFESNTAEFKIYNAKKETRNEFLKAGNNLEFSAGYEDESTGIIFIGNITESITYKEDTNWVTEIKAESFFGKSKQIDYTWISYSFNNDTLVSNVLQKISAVLGLSLFGSKNANVKLKKGYIYTGSPRTVLQHMKGVLNKEGIGLYIDNEEIVVYKLGEKDSHFNVINLKYDTGLKSVREIIDEKIENEAVKDKKKIEFESILIHQLQPNGLINIETESINGGFLIDKVEFYGDNFGGDFSCRGEASSE